MSRRCVLCGVEVRYRNSILAQYPGVEGDLCQLLGVSRKVRMPMKRDGIYCRMDVWYPGPAARPLSPGGGRVLAPRPLLALHGGPPGRAVGPVLPE